MLFIGRRRFYRRNQAGLEEYGSYKSALANAAVNKIVSIASALFFFLGVVMVVVYVSKS